VIRSGLEALGRGSALEKLRDPPAQLLRVDGLREEVVRPEVERLDRRLDITVATDHEDRNGGASPPEYLHDLEPAEPWHPHVQEQEVHRFPLEHARRLCSVGGRLDPVALVAEELGGRAPERDIVIHDEKQTGVGRRRGRARA
jgi:hypothetical protein